MKVFLSVGKTYTPEQEAFVSSFETFLSQNGCERLTVGRGAHFADQPIVAARDLMDSADGLIVLAFTRQFVIKALDKPGSDEEREIANGRYPTVWNQMEAAMAFGLRLPLLVIIEKGLTQEAMLKDRLEYRALVTEFTPGFIQSEEFRGIFADWKRKAQLRPATKAGKIEGLTVGRLLQELTPDQFWKVGGALVSSMAGIAGLAFWLGKTLGGP